MAPTQQVELPREPLCSLRPTNPHALHRLSRLLHHFSPPKFTREFTKIHEYIQNSNNLPIEEYWALGIVIIQGLLATSIDPKLPQKKRKLCKIRIIRRTLPILFNCARVTSKTNNFHRGFEMIYWKWKSEISFFEFYEILKKHISLSEYSTESRGVFATLVEKHKKQLLKGFEPVKTPIEVFIEIFRFCTPRGPYTAL